jgi:hypothetical protein
VAPLALKLCANIYSVVQNKLGANYFFIVILRLSSSDLKAVVFVCENITGQKNAELKTAAAKQLATPPSPDTLQPARACLYEWFCMISSDSDCVHCKRLKVFCQQSALFVAQFSCVKTC